MKENKNCKKFIYSYPHPAVTVDIVVLKKEENIWKVLLIKRAKEPYKGRWALPGGFVNIDEDLEDAAKRELKEETNLEAKKLYQFYTFGEPNRDPRERVISVGYITILPADENPANIRASSDAKEVAWVPINEIPYKPLAFDHSKIIQKAITYLKILKKAGILEEDIDGLC